jgi:3-mercaptopyruvate sulfurtransferase SseA
MNIHNEIAADPQTALGHFEKLLSLETDCWDVHAALASGAPGFVLLDVRSPQAFEGGHVPGSLHLPHGRINERNLAAYPPIRDSLSIAAGRIATEPTALQFVWRAWAGT